jgi:hypothetical protein
MSWTPKGRRPSGTAHEGLSGSERFVARVAVSVAVDATRTGGVLPLGTGQVGFEEDTSGGSFTAR